VAIPLAGELQGGVTVVWPGDRSKPWDPVATEALVFLLGDTGHSGRLGRALVEPGLASWAKASLEEAGTPGFLMVRAVAEPQDTPEVLERIRRVLEDTVERGFTHAELEEAEAHRREVLADSQVEPRRAAMAALRHLFRPPGSRPGSLTLSRLNDTARRLFSHGAPLALVTGQDDRPREAGGRTAEVGSDVVVATDGAPPGPAAWRR
jgi:hypothetical protein